MVASRVIDTPLVQTRLTNKSLGQADLGNKALTDKRSGQEGISNQASTDADLGQTCLINVEICYVQPDLIWQKNLMLSPGTSLRQAVLASGFANELPDVNWLKTGVGVFGKRLPLDTPAQDLDRIEIYRALVFNPNESRQRRAAHRARLLAKPKEPRRSRKPKA